MNPYLQLIPTFGLLAIGHILKRSNLLKTEDGKNILKYAFYISTPFLSIRALSTIDLRFDLLVFPLASFLLITFSYFVVQLLKKGLKLPTKSFAVMLIATMIVNSGFTLPFVLAKFSDQGAALVSLFNIMNNIMVFGWVYYLAVRFGNTSSDKLSAIKKVLISPPLWGVGIGLILNYGHVTLPEYLLNIINPLANMTGPLMLLAFGLMWEPHLRNPVQTLYSLLIRMLGGFLVGYLIVLLFGLTGVSRSVMLMLSASPVGFNTVTFSSLENLDDDYAISIVSMGLLVGIFVMGLLSVIL
jgi:predicted permease